MNAFADSMKLNPTAAKLLEQNARLVDELKRLRAAAVGVTCLHVPYGAYLRWRDDGDSAAADALTEYEDAISALRAVVAEGKPQP